MKVSTEILEEINKKIRNKRILFNRKNKIVSKIKLNYTIIKTEKDLILKIYSYYKKQIVLAYDLKNKKFIKTSDIGISNQYKFDYFLHFKGKNKIIDYTSSDHFLKNIKKD